MAADPGRALLAAARERRLPHAILLEGRPGGSARRAAAELARALFCQAARGSEPCGTCIDCLQVQAGTHPDWIVLSPAEGSAGIKIEEVRALLARISLRPYRAPAQLVLVEPADKLNEVCQNALLKTLEEPEEHTYFILSSPQPEKLLPTVRSRTQRFDLSEDEPGPADPEAERLSRLVLEFVLYDIDGTSAAGSGRPRADCLARVPDLSKLERPALAGLFDGLIAYYRDLLYVRSGAPDALPGDSTLSEKKRFAPALDPDAICDRIEIFSRTKESILHNANARIALAAFWNELIDTRPENRTP